MLHLLIELRALLCYTVSMEKHQDFLEYSKLDESKLEAVRDQFPHEPNAVFILVGAMKETKLKDRTSEDEDAKIETGEWRSGTFSDPDENGELATGVKMGTGGRDRVEAAAVIHQAFPNAVIVPMSRPRATHKPTYAAVAHTELLQMGVAAEQILLEDVSVNTITEFKEAAKMWKEHQWKNLVFISSNWHMPRVEALFNRLENFVNPEEEQLINEFVTAIKNGELLIQFTGSTDILEIKNPRYREFIEKAEASPSMQLRIEAEKSTLVQMANGHYGPLEKGGKLTPKKIWSQKF